MNYSALAALIFITLVAAPGVTAQRDGLDPHGTLTTTIECDACHTMDGWRPIKARPDFDHDRSTDFALTGRHRAAACGSCHLGLLFDEPAVSTTDCATCHLDIHQGGLSDNCLSCHNTTAFTDVAGTDLHAKTSFPLTGAHLQVSCDACHPGNERGTFAAIATDCYSCHGPDYQSAEPIDHAAAGFSTDCTPCHSTLAFTYGVTFEHATLSGGFELTGAHATIRCASCHVGGNGDLIFPVSDAADCIGCHQADYDREHGGSGFPTTCLSCHSNTTWEGGGFTDHDALAFPIFTGKHRNKWNDCQVCHTTADFKMFTCFNCHEHSQARMNDTHSDESGYLYDSNACLRCHPDGRS